MSHYEQRLEADLQAVLDEVTSQAGLVERAVTDSVRALLAGDRELANQVVIGDHPINRAMRRIDRLCHAFIARHLPSAGHLRLISAIIRINIELERIGDYAVTIARESIQQPQSPEGVIASQLALMARESQRMLSQAISAFATRSSDTATATMVIADLVQDQFNFLFDELIEMSSKTPGSAGQMFGLLTVVNMLERVSDQAKNICEETVFAITGRAKARKTYRFLFFERPTGLMAPLACAIGRKNYRNSGSFEWAGLATHLDPRLEQFMTAHGLSLPLPPADPKMPLDQLDQYHVIVSLDQPVISYLPAVPFHPATFTWNIEGSPAGLQGADFESAMESVYRDVSVRLHQAMETLYGEDAD